MPTKERYKRIVRDNIRCVKCGKPLDDKEFVTCSRCRGSGSKLSKAEDKELRQSAMALFGIGRQR